MSQPDGDGQQSGQTDPSQQSGTGEPQGTTGSGTPTDQGDQQSGTGDQQTGQPNQQEAELRRKLALSDRRAQEAETKLRESERAKMDETERTKAELTDAKKSLEDAKTLIEEQALQLAFLTDNSYKWKNPKTALKLADLSGVEISDDGSVKGLKEALKKLAESEKYLLEEDAPDDGKQPPRRTPAGAPVGGNAGSGSTRTTLEQKFHGLRGRI